MFAFCFSKAVYNCSIIFKAFGPLKALSFAVPKVHYVRTYSALLSQARSSLKQCIVVHSRVCMTEVHLVLEE